MDPSLRAHSEAKGEAIQKQYLDCFVALLLAMTRALGQFRRTRSAKAKDIQAWSYLHIAAVDAKYTIRAGY
jgi:hypothetical protein